MEKTDFIDVTTPGWWLLELKLEPRLDEMRKKVGACWGWTDEDGWFAKPDSLQLVFEFLADNKGGLLNELDEPQDIDKREKWCNDLIDAKKLAEKPAEPKGGQEVVPPPGKVVSPPPVPPPKKVSAFKAKAADQTPAEQSAESAAVAAEAAAAVQTAEPKKPSPFGRKKAASAEPVVEAPAAGGTPTPPPAPPTPAELEATLSALAENPAIPISKEEFQEAMKDPEFGAKLAAAEAELEAELQAELAAELEAELASAEAEK